MATIVNFNGKRIVEPGVYATIKSGIPVAPSVVSSGNVAIIDTGSGREFGGGSGINGQLKKGLNSVYAFSDINDFQTFLRGGIWFDLADYIFNPADNEPGPGVVYFIRAAETTGAAITFNFTGGGSNGGVFKAKTLNEGLGANGYKNGTLAKTILTVNAPITVGDTIQIKVNEGSVVNISDLITADSTSKIALQAKIIASINEYAAGYKAKMQGGEILLTTRKVYAPESSNGWAVTVTVTGTVTGSAPAFSGGINGTLLSTGYAAIMSPGNNEPSKFMIKFYEGTYRGMTPGGNHYGGLSPEKAEAALVATSPEFDNLDTLIEWAKVDANFNARFYIDDETVIIGNGNVDSDDLNGADATYTLQYTGTVAIGDTAQLNAIENGTPLAITGVVTSTSTNIATFRSQVVNAINTFGSGYTAVISGANIIVTARPDISPKSDANGNTLATVVSGSYTTGGGPSFAGGVDSYDDYNVASGGTELYTAAALDKVLNDIRELDNEFFLCDRFGDEAIGVQNVKIQNYIHEIAEFDKQMIVGGGIDDTKFSEGVVNGSIEIAKFYDDDRVMVAHSGFSRKNASGIGEEKMPALYLAANVIGRLGGLEPQVPGTFKKIKITNITDTMGKDRREQALIKGVIHVRNVPGLGNVINQTINTLQQNSTLYNVDGKSFEVSITRIGGQLNKELIIGMRVLFVGNNRGSITAADVTTYIENFLFSKTATNSRDNLIIGFKNVTTRLVEDYYDSKYGFVANSPINKLFATGFQLDPNIFN